jgi:hypothetical protein
MKSSRPPLPPAAYSRPDKLYRYSRKEWLERALQFGEFLLQPAKSEAMPLLPESEQILPFGRRAALPSTYLILSLASAWSEKLFDEFASADCCLVIHDPEQFGERIHRAAQKALPNWAGIDAGVSYGMPSPLGAAFSKDRKLAHHKEWLFAWRPTKSLVTFNPVVIQIGSIEAISELRTPGA